MRSPNKRRGVRGFTLLEALVAVAILAIALGAIITSVARYADNANRLRDKTLALWVAHNRLTAIELLPSWPDIGTSSDEASMGGHRWRWHMTVRSTADPHVRRVDIRVGPADGDHSMEQLTDFITSSDGRARP